MTSKVVSFLPRFLNVAEINRAYITHLFRYLPYLPLPRFLELYQDLLIELGIDSTKRLRYSDMYAQYNYQACVDT